jgi:hypothetical protein
MKTVKMYSIVFLTFFGLFFLIIGIPLHIMYQDFSWTDHFIYGLVGGALCTITYYLTRKK